MMSDNTVPTVSCVIPAFNEEARLGKCLSSVRSQRYPAEKVEVIVVDDDSRDGTVRIAREYGARVATNGEHNIERGKSIGVGIAGGDYILLMDADNALVGTDWLEKAVRALAENPRAAEAQSAWFEYNRSDPAANRYCSLMGINDPFAYYLKKRDKLTWFEREWSIAGELLRSEDDYFLVRFQERNMPTIGSQGYLISRRHVLDTDYSPYLFHMEMNLELLRSGLDEFVMLRSCVTHDHCRTLRELLAKLRRNFSLFLRQRQMRSYRWETTLRERFVALVSMVTVLRPAVDGIRGYLAVRDPAWLLHPVVCFAVPFMYAWIYLRWLTGGRK